MRSSSPANIRLTSALLFVNVIATLLLFFTPTGQASAQSANGPLYWTIREDAVFSSHWRLNAADGTAVVVLPGRSLVAMLEAERRIAAEYRISPKLLITNTPGLNAFATEGNGQALVVVYADIIPIIGDDVDVWAALFGHEFGHLYHHHSAAKETRAVVLDFLSTVVNAYEETKGRDRSALVNFGSSLVNNSFSRAQEKEADETGVRFMADAGFDPIGAVKLQEILIAKVGSSGALSFLNTHPSGEARIQDIRQVIATLPPAGTSVAADFSLQDFKQWMVLCSSDAHESGTDRSKDWSSIQQCLQKHNAEYSKRYGLCTIDLTARKAPGGFATLLACAEKSPQLHAFTYDVWAKYCSASSLAQGKVGLLNAEPTQQCVWEGDAQMAFKGALCESEVISMHLPSDRQMDQVRSCTSDSSDEAKHFTIDNWQLACDRMGNFLAGTSANKSQVVKDCLAQGPVVVAKASAGNNDLSPTEVFEQVSQVWNAPGTPVPTVLSPPVNDCDRLASHENIPGAKRVYFGFIEAPAAESACLEAIRNAKDSSRFQVNLAVVYLQQGRYADALRLAKEAASKGALNSNELLAVMYSYGLGVPRSSEKVLPLLLSEVKRGSVTALDDLGYFFSAGRDVEKSPEIALKLYKLAADNGSAMAATAEANSYISGTGVAVDVPQAIQLLRAASDTYPPALQPLSRALRATPGADPEEIRGLLARLFAQMNHFAELGSLTAQMHLGLLYTNGIGVAADKEKGFALLLESAQSGCTPAALWVAYAYLNGTGTAPDREKAIAYFRKAMDGGAPDAETQLSRLTASN